MRLYLCSDCGTYFERPKSEREYMGEFWGTPAYDTFYYCPCCNSDSYEEVEVDEDEMDDVDFELYQEREVW